MSAETERRAALDKLTESAIRLAVISAEVTNAVLVVLGLEENGGEQ